MASWSVTPSPAPTGMHTGPAPSRTASGRRCAVAPRSRTEPTRRAWLSALIDSRRGGSDFFQHTATARGWQLTGPAVYDDWDRRNKQLHAQLGPWRPFADLAADALTAVYRTYQLAGDPAADCAHLLESMAGWPLWPDVTAAALTGVGRPLGLLSNIDDQLLARTAPLQLGVIDPPWC